MTMQVKEKVLKKIEKYAKFALPGEVGGLILGNVYENGDIEVDDAILLNQKRNDSDFEITEDTMMDFTKNANDDVLERVLGWWHSHSYALLLWSSNDTATFNRLSNLSGLCLGVVVNFNKADRALGTKWRLQMRDKYDRMIDVDELNVFVKKERKWWPPINFIGDISKEFESKVVTDVVMVCPSCKGTGRIWKADKKSGTGHEVSVEGLEDNYELIDGYDDYENEYRGRF